MNKVLIKMSNGEYLKSWQYCQGYEDFVTTTNIFEAKDFSTLNIAMVGKFQPEAEAVEVHFDAQVLNTKPITEV